MDESKSLMEIMQRSMDKKDRRNRLRAENAAGDAGDRKLLVKRTPTGMYYVKYEGGGIIPEAFRTQFTSINRLRQVAISKYGDDSILKVEE